MIFFILFSGWLCFFKAEGVNLIAFISQNGLHGEITFSQDLNNQIKIQSSLETTLQYPDQIWSWGIHQFPVDYSDLDSKQRCQNLGKELQNFDESLGYLTLPGNESSVWHIERSLTGKNGIWGKSLVLSNSDNGVKICATITTKDQNIDHIAEARFFSPIAGSMYFWWLAAKETDHQDTLIYSNLYHTQETSTNPFTTHSWKIYITDIFQKDSDRPENNCNVLQVIFNPANEEVGHSIGDIDGRLGKIKVSTDVKKFETKELYHDGKLVLLPSDLRGPQRQLYVVIFDPMHPNNFLACARIRSVKSKMVKANLNEDHIKGQVTLTQRYKFEPVWLNFSIEAATKEPRDNIRYAQDVAGFKIMDLPADPTLTDQSNRCTSTGNLYNPTEINLNSLPPPGYGTQDQYAVGDLLGKLKNRNKEYEHTFIIPEKSMELNGIYWDVFLTLEGPHSVVHRGFLIEKYNRSVPIDPSSAIWTCGALLFYNPRSSYQIPMTTLEIQFRYPIVGRILFRQPQDEPWLDTIILIEYLIHADGSTLNTTNGHRWAIHSEGPGKDFYNWTGRCLSTKDIYNPYQIKYKTGESQDSCGPQHPFMCKLGDLSKRLAPLTISGSRYERKQSRALLTDSNLPLSGYNKIHKKSLVIYDDFGPVARGERLACSTIEGYHWRKTVANNWHTNGFGQAVKGKIEIFQQSEYDLTNIEVTFKGLMDNSGYHVHVAPVVGDLEFPCEKSSLYGTYNPRKLNIKEVYSPVFDSTDQYEMGDLSGKFGSLDGLQEYSSHYNDTNLPVFGYETVLGRSIVIHKKEKNYRWSCSTLERGYSPSEAREIRAMASFHHPDGYAYGFIRFTQLIHKDGSKSDTIIEVNLRHPGQNDRNLTRNHNWNIFVNQVGVDAVVKQTATRCVAGGYIWNPYYTQLADPLNGELYRRECSPDNPLRCYVGDVSARLGPIDLGDKRVMFADKNFPLEGTESAVGRSIVLFGPNFSSERYACANIEPDHDIVKYINLQKPPKFVVAQFLEDVRHVMGLPQWMLSIDSRNTKTLHNNACIQMNVHFKGSRAHQIEQDFSRLISTGRLDDPSLFIPGYFNQKRKKTLSYRTCGVRDPNESSTRRRFFASSAQHLLKSSKSNWFIISCIIEIMIFYLF